MTHCEKRRFSAAVIALLIVVMLFEAIAPSVAFAYPGVKNLQISAPSVVKVTEGQSTNVAIKFKGQGIDKVSLTRSGAKLSVGFVKSTWKAYPNWCSATVKVTAASGAKDGTFTVNLVNNKYGIVKKATIKIDVVAKAKITFSSISGPGTITEGTGQHINGKITSTGSKIASIKGAVTNSSGKVVLSKTVKPNAYSYSLYNSALDNGLTFGKLSAGKYTLKYTVKTVDGTTATKSVSFTVKAVSNPITTNKNLKKYNSTYHVVKGYQKKYCYDQFDYTKYYGRVGCTATACSIALSMSGKPTTPAQYYRAGGWCSAGCTWTKMKSTASKGKADKLRQIADFLLEGKPVVIWVNGHHAVTVIGIKSTANLNKLKASDFIIADPAYGDVRTLPKASGGYYYTSDPIYTAK